jgi:hypothetical protein
MNKLLLIYHSQKSSRNAKLAEIFTAFTTYLLRDQKPGYQGQLFTAAPTHAKEDKCSYKKFVMANQGFVCMYPWKSFT